MAAVRRGHGPGRHHRRMSPAALGIVPLDLDDPSAPGGSAALRELRGRPLVAWVVQALTGSGAAPVVVALPAALETAVRGALPASTIVRVDPGVHPVAAALGASASTAEVVVVHDPLQPLVSAALVRAVVDALGDADAALAVRPVTDTLKWADAGDVVHGTADREAYRVVAGPRAYRREPLVRALRAAPLPAGPDAVLRRLQEAGGTVTLLPSAEEAFRVASDDDVDVAEAVLALASA